MMETETEGITWVGNKYKKFKNMLLEIEGTLLEVAIYLVNQMRIVGQSITRFYSDVMKELFPYKYETMAGELRIDDQYEISNVNQNQEATHSTPSSAEVTNLASVSDCCNEIVNASVEQTSSVVVLVESSEEKVMKMVSSSQDPTAEQGDHKTMQQNDDELKLKETCVMVTRDEPQLVSKEGINMKTTSEKSARKQEYEELAIYNENGKVDYVESSSPTLLEDQNKSLPSELEWELL